MAGSFWDEKLSGFECFLFDGSLRGQNGRGFFFVRKFRGFKGLVS